MNCNEPPNYGDFGNNVLQMGMQTQVPSKAMHPCFQVPNAPTAWVRILLVAPNIWVTSKETRLKTLFQSPRRRER